MSRFAHPVDEPCPPGCPTRLEEIADYVAGRYEGLYDDARPSCITAGDVREALALAPGERSFLQRQIAEVEKTWA